jgi:hypothetical protein
MDPSGINNFEEQWRKALSEASETPPKSIWENIEARLDENSEKGAVLPLWWQSKKLWLAAASVAALLVVGAGFWFSDSAKNGQNRIEVAGKAAQSPATEKTNTPEAGRAAAQENTEAVAANAPDNIEATDSKSVIKENNQTLASATTPRRNVENSSGRSSASRVNSQSSIGAAGKSDIAPVENSVLERNQDFAQSDNPASTSISSNDIQNDILAKTESSEKAIAVDMLATPAYNELDIHMQKRYVFFKPDAIAKEDIKPKKHTEYWAGIGLMPASFNPDVQLKNAPQDFSYQALSRTKAVTASSEAGISYALQTHGGVRISKHWSVELGLSYLQGNSSYEGGGYLINSKSQSTNVLENALADASKGSSYSGGTDKFNNGALYVDITNKVANNYQYLQMPVQAGFTLNPDKKLSYSLLGGMMANFFLSNQIEAASGDIITTKASDEIYRSMNWAATTGLRFNYRLSSRWKANLTGSYQKAISSGFRSNQTLDAHPYLYGVAWGVRYSF